MSQADSLEGLGDFAAVTHVAAGLAEDRPASICQPALQGAPWTGGRAPGWCRAGVSGHPAGQVCLCPSAGPYQRIRQVKALGGKPHDSFQSLQACP